MKRLLQARHVSGGNGKPATDPIAPGKKQQASSKRWLSFLDDLDMMGASRPVKIVIVVAISVLGTMETIFYFQAAKRYFFPADNLQEKEGSA